jgi:hypothetical protein
MDREQLEQRIEDRERAHQAMVAQRQRLTNEIVGLEGAIIELRRMLQEMDEESEGEDD